MSRKTYHLNVILDEELYNEFHKVCGGHYGAKAIVIRTMIKRYVKEAKSSSKESTSCEE